MKVVHCCGGYGMRMRAAESDGLRRVRKYLGDEPDFVANYADVLIDSPLEEMIERTVTGGALASMLVVPPQSSFHCVNVAPTGEVKEVMPLTDISLADREVLVRRRGLPRPDEYPRCAAPQPLRGSLRRQQGQRRNLEG